MTSLIRSAAASRRFSAGRGLARLLGMLALRRSRQSLAMLDDHMLRDIGLTREQAVAEAERAAWDATPSWRRG